MGDGENKISGRLLYFDKPIKEDHMFLSTSNITIPNKILLLMNFKLDEIVGSGEVYRDDKGLIFNGIIENKGFLEPIKAVEGIYGIGGYYYRLKTHKENGIRIIDATTLVYCSITSAPVDKDYVFYLGGIKMGNITNNINPDHYSKECSLECIEAMEIVFGEEAVLNFCICNAWKYIWRWKNKNGKEDLEKAKWYIKKCYTYNSNIPDSYLCMLDRMDDYIKMMIET